MSGQDYIALPISMAICKVAAGFGAGVLLKRTFWREVIRGKKWLANEVLTLSLLAVRQYPKIAVKEMSISVFDYIKPKIQDVKLITQNSWKIKNKYWLVTYRDLQEVLQNGDTLQSLRVRA